MSLNAIWGIYHYHSQKPVVFAEMMAMGKTLGFTDVPQGAVKILGPVGLGCWSPRNGILGMSSVAEYHMQFLAFDGFLTNQNELKGFSADQGDSFNSFPYSGEVFLCLFEKKREKSFAMLKGMFSAALWDEKEKQLFLVRDRFGVRPLYFYDDGKSVFFASAIKSIINATGVRKTLNHEAFVDYLSLGYIPFGQTIFYGIGKVQPRHYLSYSPKQKNYRVYWDFPVPSLLKTSVQEIEVELGDRLKSAIRHLIVPSQPAGVFLSGGLDSAAIAYYLKELKNEPFKTFGVGFEEKGYNETYYAKIVADSLGVTHQSVFLKDRFLQEYEKIITSYENLHGEISTIPFYYLSMAVAKEKEMAFCGEGGDEFLGGYPEMIADTLVGYYQKIPLFLRRLFRFLADTVPVSDAPISFDYKLKHFLRGAEYESLRAHYSWREVFTEKEIRRLLYDDFFVRTSGPATFEKYKAQFYSYTCRDMLQKMQYGYFNALIPDNNLPYYDTLGSIHGLAIHYPYLDYDLVDFMLTIPMSMKIRGMTTKYVMRRLLAHKLPPVIVARGKHGLSCPLKIWIRGKMKDIFRERFDAGILKKHPYLNAEYIALLFQDHLERKRDNSRKLWNLFSFLVWYDKYFTGQNSD